MKPLRNLLLAASLAAALATASLATTTPDPLKTGISQVRDLGDFTYASLPSATLHAYREAVATNLGTNGTKVRSNGTRWLVAGGMSILSKLGASVTGIANSETIVLQAVIPAGAWQTNDIVRVNIAPTKSGTTDTLNLVIRFGTAGTTADTAMATFTGLYAASQVSGGISHDFKLISATSAQRIGASAVVGSYGSLSTSGASGVQEISNASANAIYVSVTIASSGATDTVGAHEGYIQLITP